MARKYKIIGAIVVLAAAAGLLGWYLSGTSIPVLQPKGPIAYRERQLIIITLLMSLIVVIPVFGMLLVFSLRYREGNKKAKYSPDWDHSRIAETIWWVVPSLLILVLGVIIWRSSYELDPYKPLSSAKKPITIQVVALDWKWLFIYPDQKIASVNSFQIPEKTPIRFEITADAPMNSFWLPQLGGQIYAMPGMSTQLNLMANTTGTYRGSSANISGRGFSSMSFTAHATTDAEYQAWLKQAKAAPKVLNQDTYNLLATPKIDNSVTYFKQTETGLYDTILMKYMLPSHQMSDEHNHTNVTVGTP